MTPRPRSASPVRPVPTPAQRCWVLAQLFWSIATLAALAPAVLEAARPLLATLAR